MVFFFIKLEKKLLIINCVDNNNWMIITVCQTNIRSKQFKQNKIYELKTSSKFSKCHFQSKHLSLELPNFKYYVET